MRNLPIKQLTLPLLFTTLVGVIVIALPIFDQGIGSSKFFFLAILALLITLLYLLQAFKKNTLKVTNSPLLLPLAGFGLVTLISSLGTNLYPVENLLGFGGIYLSTVFIAIFGGSLLEINPKNNKYLFYALSGSVWFVIVSSLLQLTGYGPSKVFNNLLNIDIPNSIVFNPAGSLLVAMQVISIVFVGLLTLFLFKKKRELWQTTTLIASGLSAIGYGWMLLFGKSTQPILLAPMASWAIALSSLRNVKNLLIGVGPSGYLNAFNQLKPQWFNNLDVWNIQFSQGANFPLTIIVTMGIFAFVAWITLFIVVLLQTRQVSSSTKPIHNMLIATFVIQTFLPGNIVLLTIQAVLMAFWIANEKERFTAIEFKSTRLLSKIRPLAGKSMLINRVLIGLLIAIVVLAIIFVKLAAYASFTMFRANQAVGRNDIVTVYNLQRKAIRINPYLDTYHRRYSVTNIVIAAALSQKTDLTDEDRQQFAQLISQGIREGKAAVTLDPADPVNWLSLSQIYQSLIGVAENAEDWAIKSYTNTVKLVPYSPELRISLGGLFYSGGDFESALRLFEQAVILKPDYANAYYNAANALKELERFDDAKSAYQKTLLLLQPDSEDYIKTATELELLEDLASGELQKRLDEESEKNNDTIENRAKEDTARLENVQPVQNQNPEIDEPPQGPQPNTTNQEEYTEIPTPTPQASGE